MQKTDRIATYVPNTDTALCKVPAEIIRASEAESKYLARYQHVAYLSGTNYFQIFTRLVEVVVHQPFGQIDPGLFSSGSHAKSFIKRKRKGFVAQDMLSSLGGFGGALGVQWLGSEL